jgi:hypothetical protein
MRIDCDLTSTAAVARWGPVTQGHSWLFPNSSPSIAEAAPAPANAHAKRLRESVAVGRPAVAVRGPEPDQQIGGCLATTVGVAAQERGHPGFARPGSGSDELSRPVAIAAAVSGRYAASLLTGATEASAQGYLLAQKS